MSNKKNKSGITLIALIITIIVLLILAGISISLVVGQNGVLTRSQQASTKTKESQAQEAFERGLVTVQSDFFTETASGETRDSQGDYITLSKIQTNLDNGYKLCTSTGGDYTDSKISENPDIYIKDENNQVYKVKYDIDSDGKISNIKVTIYTGGEDEEESSEPVIGAEVKFNNGNPIPVANGQIDDNWKVFYYDDENVYIIYGDYYPVYDGDVVDISKQIQSVDTDSGISLANSSTNRKRAIWANNKNDLISYLKNSKEYSYSNYETEGNYDSVSSASYDDSYKIWKDLWDGLKNTSNGLGEKIIEVQGSPNLTMWCDSWNKKGYESLTATNQGTNGYYVQYNGNTANNYQNVSGDAGYSDKLYFPYNNDNQSGAPGAGYWLVSPSGVGSSSMLCVDNGGYINDTRYYYTIVCARPVVTIPRADFK